MAQRGRYLLTFLIEARDREEAMDISRGLFRGLRESGHATPGSASWCRDWDADLELWPDDDLPKPAA